MIDCSVTVLMDRQKEDEPRRKAKCLSIKKKKKQSLISLHPAKEKDFLLLQRSRVNDSITSSINIPVVTLKTG